MSPRKLRPDEEQLWNQVARTTDRLFPLEKAKRPEPTKALPDVTTVPTETEVPRFDVGSQAKPLPEIHQSTRRMRDRLADHPVRMDARTHGKMTRGKLKPEGRIDLHGMSQAQAHPALIGFIHASHAAGKRLVLVITGKGSPDEAPWPIPRRRGVLRQVVPQWLASGPAASAVLQVTPAHLRHGGDGAYYVYLRKRR
ncbi:Smr/MutS family protein [Pseudaestuariivita atlantica]|uniref:Smr domain-containing protein n=1 Tax=Pseudaestuariivita atlantica TaxID=1317121 RepID=A0A0L1JPL7_9RHOB|nr:Smr/MutS family protein [Pseudaestuariivita atlantica]KNG93710.1 hypothetical protein ATO11_11005 [Pseudaestuariivita atlantica]